MRGVATEVSTTKMQRKPEMLMPSIWERAFWKELQQNQEVICG